MLCTLHCYFHSKTLFSWSVLRGYKQNSRVRSFCEKGLHPLQLLLCLSDQPPFPALPFQICYAFRSPFLSPVMFYCFCFSSYGQITFISPLLAIYLRRRQIQLPPPCTKFMEHCCLPYEGAFFFFCFSDFSFPAPFSRGRFSFTHFSPLYSLTTKPPHLLCSRVTVDCIFHPLLSILPSFLVALTLVYLSVFRYQ